MINDFCGIGRLATNPHIGTSPIGKEYSKFIVEIPRPKTEGEQDKKDRINCSAFGKLVNVVKYIEAGDLVAIQGSLQTASYQKNGEWVNTWNIVIGKIVVLQRGKNQQPTPAPAPVPVPPPQTVPAPPPNPEEILPFDMFGGGF